MMGIYSLLLRINSLPSNEMLARTCSRFYSKSVEVVCWVIINPLIVILNNNCVCMCQPAPVTQWLARILKLRKETTIPIDRLPFQNSLPDNVQFIESCMAGCWIRFQTNLRILHFNKYTYIYICIYVYSYHSPCASIKCKYFFYTSRMTTGANYDTTPNIKIKIK